MKKSGRAKVRGVNDQFLIGKDNALAPYWGVIAASVAFLLYANTIGHGYALDDTAAVTDNKFVQEGLAGIPKLLTIDFWHFAGLNLGYYRPLSLITFAIEFEFFGLSPHVSHLINVLLFSLTVFILFQFLKEFFDLPALSTNKPLPKPRTRFESWKFSQSTMLHPFFPLMVSLLFAVHPIHTEVVANIKGRDELLSFLNILLTLFLFLRYLGKKNLKFLTLSLLFFYMALLSKESALTGILILPLVIWYKGENKLRKVFTGILPFLAVIACFYLQKNLLFETSHPFIPDDIVNYPYNKPELKFSTAFFLFLFSLRMLIFPHPLRYEYSYNQIPAVAWDSLWAWFGLTLFLVVFVIGVTELRKRSRTGFAVFFYLITILPLMGFTILRGGIFVERSLFAPSLGYCMILVILSDCLTKTDLTFSIPVKTWIKKSGLPAGILLIILVLYSVKTISRNSDWKDSFAIYSADIASGGNSVLNNLHLGNYWLGKAYHEENATVKMEEISKGIGYLQHTLYILPDFTDVLFKLGYAYEIRLSVDRNEKSLDSAIWYFNRTIRLNPDSYKSFKNLGIIYEWLGQFEVASYCYIKAAEINPGYQEARIKAEKLKETRGLDVRINPRPMDSFPAIPKYK